MRSVEGLRAMVLALHFSPKCSHALAVFPSRQPNSFASTSDFLRFDRIVSRLLKISIHGMSRFIFELLRKVLGNGSVLPTSYESYFNFRLLLTQTFQKIF